MRRLTLTATLALCLMALGSASASAAAPVISLTTISAITTNSVVLEADINPEKKATSYHFEYGPQPCDSNPCTSIPDPEEEISAGESPQRVQAPVTGLAPGATYHFRVLATNSLGTTEGPDKTFSTYPLEAIFGPCPNEIFRSGELSPPGHPSAALPECRAYEQASPVNKNGLDAIGNLPTLKASPSGEAVTFATASGISSDDGAQSFPLHLARRGEGDWSTLGMLPPESYGQKSEVIGWSEDFSQIFDRATKVGEPQLKAFLQRSGTDGSIATIFPHTDLVNDGDYFFVGASADGSKVFFEATGTPLTKDALAHKDNLYVWDRETETLGLAGVLPDSDCGSPPCVPPGGSFAGPYDWVNGTTKTSLAQGGAGRDYYTQAEHAIANDGSAYFTAGESGQIYLRTDPAGPNPKTLHVSESKKNNGTGPEHHDAAGTRPAAFMAATPDGSRAFFTSSEKLTNDATTGVEPLPPAIARADLTDGKNAKLDFLFAHASGLATDSEYIYWANPDEGTIGRAKLNGSEPKDLITTEVGIPQYVAVDGEYIYWTNKGDGQDGQGTIGRAKLNGSEPKEDFIIGASNPQGIAVNSEHIYWANAGGELETRTIGRANIDGSTPEEKFIPIDSGAQEATPRGLAVNAASIYWTRHNTQESSYIVRRDLNGSAGSEISISDFGATDERGIALDGGHVYWARRDVNTIARANLDLSGADFEFIKGAAHPLGLALDASHILWSANQGALPNPGRDLYRWDAATKSLSDLTVDHTDANGAEVRGVLGTSKDGSYVYFVANGVLSATPNARGEVAQAGDCDEALGSGGTCNLYLAREGEPVVFIARLEEEANWTGTPTGVTVTITRFQKTARVSADGRTLLFRSARQLSDYDNDAKRELYRYRAGQPGLLCLSCNPTGAPPVSAEPSSIETAVLAIPKPASTLSRSLSDDGNRVFFESTDRLTIGDTNGEKGCPTVGSSLQEFPACQDVYEWEAKGTGSCESEAQNGGCLYLISTGKSPEPSFFADASNSGDDVFLFTRSQLVGQDGDQLLDVYDARTGGGLASQNKLASIECESSEGCQGSTPSPPAYESPGTEGLSGADNVHKKRKGSCAKHKRKGSKGKAHCAAKKHNHHHKGKRRGARATGRASR